MLGPSPSSSSSLPPPPPPPERPTIIDETKETVEAREEKEDGKNQETTRVQSVKREENDLERSLREEEPRSKIDWDDLRRKSLRPGGFGEERVRLWPLVLGVSHPYTSASTSSVASSSKSVPEPKVNGSADGHGKPEESGDQDDPVEQRKEGEEEWQTLSPHRDERQIKLDTDRSFVLYDGLDSSLSSTSTSPSPSSSTQTLPPLPREHHQSSLLTLLTRLFRSHPKLSYFQGFHDISTVIYLTFRDDPEVMYRVLEKMSLQRVRDSMGKGLEPVLGLVRITRNLLTLSSPTYSLLLAQASGSALPFYTLSNLLTLFSHDMPSLELIQHVFDWVLVREPVGVVYLVAAILLARKEELERLQDGGEDDEDDMDPGMAHSILSSLPAIVDSYPEEREEAGVELKKEVEEVPVGELIPIPAPTPTPIPTPIPNGDARHPLEGSGGEREEDEEPSEPPSPPSPSTSPYPSLSQSHSFPSHSHPHHSSPPTSDPSPAPSPSTTTTTKPKEKKSPPRPLSLTKLLREADSLMRQYPPTHPDLRLGEIMGPKSVVFTWKEAFEELPKDEEVEGYVENVDGIVFPYVPTPIPSDDEDEEEEDELDLISEKPPLSPHRRSRRHRRTSSIGNSKEARRKLRKPRRQWYLTHRRQAIVTTTVLVLGVALAIYGGAERNGVVREREWGKLVAWVSAVVLGV